MSICYYIILITIFVVINLKSKIMTIAKFIPSVEIKHAKDTTDNSKVWFDYWIKQTKEDISNLPTWNCECCNEEVPIGEMVGAHVIKADGSDETVYIYPTCDTCNKTYKGEKADIKVFSVPITKLVPAP